MAPSPIPFGPGGAESVWAGLYYELLTASSHDVELIKVPVRETTLPEVMAAYESFTSLDLSHFDMVITGKYPAWMVSHPRHVVYMLHPLRGLYDSYRLFALPLVETSLEPLIRRLIVRAASLHADAMPNFFHAWRTALDTLGPEHPALSFPGPLARTLVHAMDRVALRPGAVSRYLAISKTVAERTDYFPAGVPVQVVHPPSDLAGLHELPGEYFFTASRHDAPKRLDLLLEGMRHYSGDRRLVIAGTGPETERLRDMAARDPRVELVGRVSQAQLVDHYARAVGVPFIPLDEDLGLITFEAMRAGKPVLTACDSGGPTEFVIPGVNGVVVSPTPAGIGEGLGQLERLGASPRVAEAARRAVQGTTWSRVVEELVCAPTPERVLGVAGSGRPRLVVTSTFPIWPPRNGGQMRAYHLYGALTDSFDIELICLAPPSAPPSTHEIRPGMVERVIPRTEAHDAEELAITREVGLPVTDIVAGRLIRFTPDYLRALNSALRGAAGVILADPFMCPVVSAVNTGVPLVYDVHHHRCNPDGMSVEQATREALATWNREALFHISSPMGGWKGPKRERHHDFIDVTDFPACWRRKRITVEVEARAKEVAVLRLLAWLKESDAQWFVYIVRCADGSLYTGITNDVGRRCEQHNAGTASRYTRSRLPVALVYQEAQASRSLASKRESAIKALSRQMKESLIRSAG